MNQERGLMTGATNLEAELQAALERPLAAHFIQEIES